MDNVYLTEYIIGNEKHAGPRITAETLEGAIFKASSLAEKVHINLKVVGKLVLEVEQFDMN